MQELGPNNKKILIKISCPALGDTLCATPTVKKVALSYGHKVDVIPSIMSKQWPMSLLKIINQF